MTVPAPVFCHECHEGPGLLDNFVYVVHYTTLGGVSFPQ